jgi:GT2 family glycosyltransferase
MKSLNVAGVPDARAQTSPRLTVAVCSNRPECLERTVRRIVRELGPADRLLVVLDVARTSTVRAAELAIREAGAHVILNGANLGLSRSRNVALDACETEHIVFIDDDVMLSAATLDGIRRGFRAGFGIVGVRIRGPETELALPWHISQGQLHYLGIHNDRVTTTWGACMAMSMSAVRERKLAFREDLGRKGRKLSSGEDTSFLSALRNSGVKEVFIPDVFVNHNIGSERLTVRYMARRAYWQGRTELLRRNVVGGMRKEIARNWNADTGLIRTFALTAFYGVCVLVGIVHGALASRLGPNRRVMRKPPQ